MPVTRIDKRFIGTNLDNENIAAGANIDPSKIANNADVIRRNGSVPFTGNQSMGNNNLTSVGTATQNDHAVNLGQMNTAISNALNPFNDKGTVRVASTVNLTLSGTQTIDGVAVIAGERVLVKNQTNPAENGIYVVAAGAWTRSADMDSWAEVPGAWVVVQEGTANADTVWIGTANKGGTLNSTGITFINPFAGLGAGLNNSSFVFNETPAGTVNGVNTAFTLANTPTAGTLLLHLNGIRLRPGAGNDYTQSGAAITFAVAPLTNEFISADYMK